MKNSPRRYRLSSVVIVLALLSVASYFVSLELFWFVGGLTLIVATIAIIANWESIIVWWATRGHK